MDPEVRDEMEARLERARRRSITYCRGCGGTLSVESPHPLGGTLVVVSCPGCGREETLVREGQRLKRPGNRRRKPSLD